MLSVDITTMQSLPANDIKTATYSPVNNTSAGSLNSPSYVDKNDESKAINKDTTINDTTDINSTKQVFVKVKSIIMDKLGVAEEEVTSEASFTNDLGADSLDTVELIMEFEKEFNISIPDEEAEAITTVGQAVTYLTKRLHD